MSFRHSKWGTGLWRLIGASAFGWGLFTILTNSLGLPVWFSIYPTILVFGYFLFLGEDALKWWFWFWYWF